MDHMESVLIKIKRQDDPDDIPYWEVFEIPYAASMTVGMRSELYGRCR